MTDIMKNTFKLMPLANFRDLGGIPVCTGYTKSGLIARSDDLSLIDEAGARSITDRGTNLILDLRSAHEATYTGRGLLGETDITYFHQPLVDEMATPGTKALTDIAQANPHQIQPAELIGEWYASLVQSHGENIRIGLEAIADSEGTTIFHCVAGKDRTGIFAASLLSLLGARDEHIITDYALSNNAMPQVIIRIQQIIALLGNNQPTSLLDQADLIAASALSMKTMLDIFHEGYGGLDSFLREVGVDGELVSTLRAHLVA